MNKEQKKIIDVARQKAKQGLLFKSEKSNATDNLKKAKIFGEDLSQKAKFKEKSK